MAGKRKVVAKKFDVVVGETDLHPGFVAAGLLRRAPWENPDRSGAEALEDVVDCAGEAVAIGQQKHNRGDAPGHPSHGQKRAAQVMAHGGGGLPEQIAVGRDYWSYE